MYFFLHEQNKSSSTLRSSSEGTNLKFNVVKVNSNELWATNLQGHHVKILYDVLKIHGEVQCGIVFLQTWKLLKNYYVINTARVNICISGSMFSHFPLLP